MYLLTFRLAPIQSKVLRNVRNTSPNPYACVSKIRKIHETVTAADWLTEFHQSTDTYMCTTHINHMCRCICKLCICLYMCTYGSIQKTFLKRCFLSPFGSRLLVDMTLINYLLTERFGILEVRNERLHSILRILLYNVTLSGFEVFVCGNCFALYLLNEGSWKDTK